MPPPPLMRASNWRSSVFVLAGLALLAGCTNGDFGEVNRTLVRDDIHDWLSLDAIAGKPTSPSSFELTDDERALRDLGYPLIEPAYDRHQWYSAAGEYGVIGADHRGPADRTAYATRLFGDRYWRVTRRSWKVCPTTLRLSCRRSVRQQRAMPG